MSKIVVAYLGSKLIATNSALHIDFGMVIPKDAAVITQTYERLLLEELRQVAEEFEFLGSQDALGFAIESSSLIQSLEQVLTWHFEFYVIMQLHWF